MSQKELTEKARELKNAYQRAWREKNKEAYNEKQREYQVTYWNKKAKELKKEA